MKGDRVEIVVAADDGSRTYEIAATRAGRRVEVTTGRGGRGRRGDTYGRARAHGQVHGEPRRGTCRTSGERDQRSAAALRVDGRIRRIPRSLSSITVNLAGPTRRFRVWPTSNTLEQRVVIHSSPLQ